MLWRHCCQILDDRFGGRILPHDSGVCRFRQASSSLLMSRSMARPNRNQLRSQQAMANCAYTISPQFDPAIAIQQARVRGLHRELTLGL